jgi:hypothetical protein
LAPDFESILLVQMTKILLQQYRHQADIAEPQINVRFWGKSGHQGLGPQRPLMTPKRTSASDQSVSDTAWSIFRKKPAPDAIRGGYRFSAENATT